MTPDPLSREEVDAALAALDGQRDRIAAALYAMDTHPGQEYLRRAALTGATLELWQRTRPEIDALWAGFGAVRDVLDRAHELRAVRPRPGRAELGTLSQLLRDPSVEVDQAASATTVSALCDRLDRSCREVLATLTTVDAKVTLLVDRLAALDTTLASARPLAGGRAEDPFDRLTADLAALRKAALADPIGTDLDTPDAKALATQIESIAARRAELVRLRAAYPARLAALEPALAALAAAQAAADQAYALASVKILDPALPPASDLAAPLRERLDRLAHADQQQLDGALPELEQAVAAAAASAGERHGFASGLLGRRDELRGRLEAYRMKAVRTGRSEDTALLERHRQAWTLLWSAPCDLPAATRAVLAYQQALSGREVS